jgi:hypothetical protein
VRCIAEPLWSENGLTPCSGSHLLPQENKLRYNFS